MRDSAAGKRTLTGGLAALLFTLAVLPALAANLQWEHFEEDPFPVWPPDDLELEEGEELPPPPWDPDWIDVRTADIDNTSIVSPGYIGDALQIELPAGTFRAVGARYYFPGEHKDEIFFRYMLRLNNWDTTSDGKLPGPAGIYGASARGCIPSTEASPGWSARMLFKATGALQAGPDDTVIGYYVYHLDQPGSCGENMIWDPGVVVHNRWYCVEGHVRLNTPGENDGVIEGWLDGVQAMRRDDMAFRRDGESNIHVREFFLNVYHGGTEPAPNDMDLTIDQLVVSDTKRPGCADPFSDDDGSVYESSLTELKNLGVFEGCAVELSCRLDPLSRYAMAVLLDRALDLPGTSEDFFVDDALWAEPMINRLAASGITLGCSENLFCPYDNITRAHFAVMLDRAFSVPDSQTDYFSDDDERGLERSINALAEAGIILGCTETTFCPDEALTRGQAALLLVRSLNWVAGQPAG